MQLLLSFAAGHSEVTYGVLFSHGIEVYGISLFPNILIVRKWSPFGSSSPLFTKAATVLICGAAVLVSSTTHWHWASKLVPLECATGPRNWCPDIFKIPSLVFSLSTFWSCAPASWKCVYTYSSKVGIVIPRPQFSLPSAKSTLVMRLMVRLVTKQVRVVTEPVCKNRYKDRQSDEYIVPLS